MEDVINVLMNRDGLSQKDAEREVHDFMNGIYSGEIDPFEAEDLFMDTFGLEPDYLLNMIM